MTFTPELPSFYFAMKEWAKYIRLGQESFEEDSRPERPVEDKVALVKELVKKIAKNDQAF